MSWKDTLTRKITVKSDFLPQALEYFQSLDPPERQQQSKPKHPNRKRCRRAGSTGSDQKHARSAAALQTTEKLAAAWESPNIEVRVSYIFL